MKKRRHHYVWKAYIRAWATNDQIAVLQDGKIRTSNINDVSVQRDFYKLHDLTPNEISYVRKFWIEPSPKHSHGMHEKTLAMFTMWPAMRRTLIEMGDSADPAMLAYVEEQIINAQEDYHAHLESLAAPLIGAARQGDLSFYEAPQNLVLISHFMALQHFRTAAMRKRIIERMKCRMGIDLTRTWNIIAHILAANVGFSIFIERKRRPLALIENTTGIPFITGDQPTVNVLGRPIDDRPPDQLALYYPISPRFALLIDDAERPCGIADASITEEVVTRLNAAESGSSERQLFANTEQELKPWQAAKAR